MKWFDVRETLPTLGSIVLIYAEDRGFQICNQLIITKYGKYGFEGNNTVTHWMYLPESPVEIDNPETQKLSELQQSLRDFIK